MINTSFYALVIPILFSLLTVIYSADPEDPCPRGADQDIVADMCTNDATEEDTSDGGKAVDSVLLRITKQQNNCICHVSLLKKLTNYTIYMSKYDNLKSAAPEEVKCGLAVDVEYQETSGSTRSLQSIECTSGTSFRSIALEGNKLLLQSRIIDGNFTRGYCMQIYRNALFSCTMKDTRNSAGHDDDYIKTNGTQHDSIEDCKAYCLNTEACVAVNYDPDKYCFVYHKMTTIISKDGSTYSHKDCVDTQKLEIKCYHPESTTQTSQDTTTEVTLSPKTDTVTTPISDSTMTSFDTQSSIPSKEGTTKDKNSALFVYIGAGAGGLLMLLLIVCIIVCIRKNSNQTSEKESKNYTKKQFCREDRDSDNDYGGLKDNILYVSSEPTEIFEDGNYNTVDLEKTRKVNHDINLDGNYSTVDGICSTSSLSKSKPVIKPKPNSSLKRGSDEETIHLSTMDNSNNEYAVVDKGRNSDAVKHTNPKQGHDTEYAVVNKVRKSSNNN